MNLKDVECFSSNDVEVSVRKTYTNVVNMLRVNDFCIVDDSRDRVDFCINNNDDIVDIVSGSS